MMEHTTQGFLEEPPPPGTCSPEHTPSPSLAAVNEVDSVSEKDRESSPITSKINTPNKDTEDLEAPLLCPARTKDSSAPHVSSVGSEDSEAPLVSSVAPLVSSAAPLLTSAVPLASSEIAEDREAPMVSSVSPRGSSKHAKGSTPLNNSHPPVMVTTQSPPIQENGTKASLSSIKPSLGAWEKPLNITTTTCLNDLQAAPLNMFWPSLNSCNEGTKKKDAFHAKELPLLPTQKLPPPEKKADGSLRFPWAAKMNPNTRNLFRAAAPSYLPDGTPKVSIPSNVLLHGPENRDEYIIGQFFRCSPPPGGLIYAVVNKLWGRKCRISCRKSGESSFIFHIPDSTTRSWIIQRGIWHIDDCLLFVAPWSPAATLSLPEISTIPVWASLKNIPDRLYSRLGISHIASGLGEPMLTNKPRLDPTLMGEAKIMVEVELDKPLPQRIALDDEEGNTFMVEVEYTWIPSKCGRCGHLGHKEKRCLLPKPTENQSLSPPFLSSHITPKDSAQLAHELPAPTNITPTTPKDSTLVSDFDSETTPKVTTSTEKLTSPENDLLPSHNTSNYAVVDTAQGLNQPILSSGIRENPMVIHQLMIPVMGSQVASAFSQRVPLQQSADTHASHHITNHGTTDPTQGSPPTKIDSLPNSQEVPPPARETICSSSLPSSLSPLTASTAVHSILNSMEETPSTGLISTYYRDSGNDCLDFGSQGFQGVISAPPMGGVYEDESGSLPHRPTTLGEFFPTTRGGRTIKPTQKFQETEWKKVMGRNSRRGRGGKYH